MSSDSGFPVSLLLDGPLFLDELETQPQHFRQEHDIDSLRLVPAKSAATGVHTVYFKPEHRQWALVRLLKRYRWLFEILLQRGLSGEHMLLRQGFSTDDLDFFYDIVPQPPAEYNPIVYDMLWLVATHDEYLALTEAMADRTRFVPERLLRETSGISADDSGYFSRFLRSHLISRTVDTSRPVDERADHTEGGTAVTPDATYEVTPEGRDALAGILAEYERIFEQREFEPLLINPELDPHEHLREYDPGPDAQAPDVSFDEMQEEEGILGEIAGSFAPLDEEFGSPAESTVDEPDDVAPEPEPVGDDRGTTAGGQSDTSGRMVEPSPERQTGTSRGRQANQTAESPDEDSPSKADEVDRQALDEQVPDETFVGEYTREEVLRAAVAAAREIHAGGLVRTSAVKSAVWEAVETEGRSRTVLWEAVRDILITMDATHGRGGGHVWASNSTTAE
ncbi:hypothetical protein SAMN05216559_1728 [Halomicrobium zhouii]|uniref:Uncharacterized protein n=2 Tax=Halomicrobium zhouii TaxID=767519 RepID=A0A1I6L071_9EURY|nr:hypothetical protein SAMN05216559_1728 [Halomicrobium zhouii]